MDEVQPRTAGPPPASGEPRSPANPKRPVWRRPLVILIGTVGLGVLFFLGFGYLADTFTHEATDDAFLDADYVSLAPKVSGQVKKVHVRSNQQVRAGDLILEIDPRDLEAQMEQKQAALKAAHANVGLLKASVELFRTQIASAEATSHQSAAETAASEAVAERANADLRRAQELMANHTISPQEFDSAKAVAGAADANLRAAREKATSDQSKVGQAQAQLQAGIRAYERAEAQTVQAESELRTAELNLSYARVSSPIDGRVTRKAVQDGDYVQIGQKLMALVPGTMYVTANFKETQLRSIRTNQPVKIKIDSVNSGPFPGRVESIMAGTGSRFSLLPPENAVGNYIKVVQRVPVKIVFNSQPHSDHVLGPGMSVVPSVRISDVEIPEGLIAVAAVVLALLLGAVWWTLARREPRGT